MIKLIGTLTTATAADFQNDFNRYLTLVQGGNEVIVTLKGEEIGRFIPKNAVVTYLTDSLTGILKKDLDIDQARTEGLEGKYALAD